MKYYQITWPHNQGDRQHSDVNGNLTHAYGLPGIKCGICGNTWGGSRVHKEKFPNDLRGNKLFKNSWPVSMDNHLELRKIVSVSTGIPLHEILPGDRFQPSILKRKKSINLPDIIWPAPSTMVVNNKIRMLFDEHQIDGIDFCQVEWNSPDVMYEVIVNNKSKKPHGVDWEKVIECSGCGRENYNSQERILKMSGDLSNGHRLFTLATTGRFYVDEIIYRALVSVNVTNVEFIVETLEKK